MKITSRNKTFEWRLRLVEWRYAQAPCWGQPCWCWWWCCDVCCWEKTTACVVTFVTFVEPTGALIDVMPHSQFLDLLSCIPYWYLQWRIRLSFFNIARSLDCPVTTEFFSFYTTRQQKFLWQESSNYLSTLQLSCFLLLWIEYAKRKGSDCGQTPASTLHQVSYSNV